MISLSNYIALKCCKKPTELKFIMDDSGTRDMGAYLFFQCKKCGKVLRCRIKDARSGGV